MEKCDVYYIGWDVGAWSCPTGQNNKKSADALVILDANGQQVGDGWKGNLRESINEITTPEAWITSLFKQCDPNISVSCSKIIMAIDTPLGFSEGFISLVANDQCISNIEKNSHDNEYLFRHTERYLMKKTNKIALSAITHMIGSQATKGIHTLRKLGSKVESCGVWKCDEHLTLLEAYPGANKGSAKIKAMQQENDPLVPLNANQDIQDAWSCALIAYLYDQERDTLESPDDEAPESEGWIWFPKDILK